MNKLKMDLKSRKGITLISLVVTIIILIILASISIAMILGNNGLLNKVQTASDETKKSQATETMNLKITNIQIHSYAETQELPNLQYLADKLCEDNDMEYVLTASKEHASLDKIDVTNISSIFTKLKEYPYEFEINSSLQLASIDGVKIAIVPSNDDDTIVSMTKAELKSLITSEVNSQLSKNPSSNSNYSTEEQVVGTWVDNKPIYRKCIDCTNSPITTNGVSKEIKIDISDLEIDTIISNYCILKSNTYNRIIPYTSVSMGSSSVTPSEISTIFYSKSDKLLKIRYTVTDNFNSILAVIEYTKTTDNPTNN